MIAAIDRNRAIGYKGKLLFHIPEDMEFFRKTTSKKGEDERYKDPMVIMGRKTYESIGSPLRNRLNVVISSQNNDKDKTIDDIFDIKIVDLYYMRYVLQMDNLMFKYRPIWIIGGQSIYEQMIDLADELYLTLVESVSLDVDSFFPEYEKDFELAEIISDGDYKGLKYKITRWIRKEK